MGRGTELVFGYGSLVEHLDPPPSRADGRVCDLLGHRRRFGVAMDNGEELPGYKVYESPDTGERPAVFVAFLDLVPSSETGSAVNGVVRPACPTELDALDRRERNYRRVEVTSLIRPLPAGRVWTYVGSPAGRARFKLGASTGRAVVSRGYRETIEAGFRALGHEEWRRYADSTDGAGLPVRSLRRIDLPVE